MKPPKKVKEVKAWAVCADQLFSSDGESTDTLQIFRKKSHAREYQHWFSGERVIPVLITPLSERGK